MAKVSIVLEKNSGMVLPLLCPFSKSNQNRSSSVTRKIRCGKQLFTCGGNQVITLKTRQQLCFSNGQFNFGSISFRNHPRNLLALSSTLTRQAEDSYASAPRKGLPRLRRRGRAGHTRVAPEQRSQCGSRRLPAGGSSALHQPHSPYQSRRCNCPLFCF